MKSGNKIEIIPFFEVSQKSLNDLYEVRKKELNDETIKFEEITFVNKDIASLFYLNVTPLIIVMRPGVDLASDVVEVGKSTSMTFKTEHGIKPKGSFKEFKNEFIEVKADGTIVGLKEGETSYMVDYTYTDDTMNQIAEAYLKENELTHLSSKDVEFTWQQIAQIVHIKVVDPSQENIDSDNNNQDSEGKTTVPGKTLPQTGTTKNIFMVTIGLTMLLSSLVLFMYKKIF